jgi:hypothetical protein
MHAQAKAYQERAYTLAGHGMTIQAMQHLYRILSRVRRFGFDTSHYLDRMLRNGILQPHNMPAARYLEKAVLADMNTRPHDPVLRQRYQDAQIARHQAREQRRRERGSALIRESLDYLYAGSDRRQAAR